MRRQAERRQDIIDVLRTKGYTRVLDLSAEEQAGRYFEGTGVLVLDRINGVAYVSLSDRAHKVCGYRVQGCDDGPRPRQHLCAAILVRAVCADCEAHSRCVRSTSLAVQNLWCECGLTVVAPAPLQELAERWVAELGYHDLVTFHSTDETGAAVYHTNVMMAVGSDVAVVCAEAVPDAKERRHLLASLRKHHEVRAADFAVDVLSQVSAVGASKLAMRDVDAGAP
jgi:N,N dimethylarginine dimethylhydrolase, eukaryotic